MEMMTTVVVTLVAQTTTLLCKLHPAWGSDGPRQEPSPRRYKAASEELGKTAEGQEAIEGSAGNTASYHLPGSASDVDAPAACRLGTYSAPAEQRNPHMYIMPDSRPE